MKSNMYILLMGFACFISGCSTGNVIDSPLYSVFLSLSSLASSPEQRAFNKRQRKELVIYMSLDALFPDSQVRSLAKAAGEGRVSQIDELVSRGINVNSRGTKNATPLFWAMRNGSIEGFKRLLELGADPNVIFDDGGTVMHWTIILENSNYLRLALEHGGNPNLVAGALEFTPLINASNSTVEIVAMLLKHGADPDMKSSRGGIPPVMWAAFSNRFDIVYVLLNNGADYSLKNNAGENLLDTIASRRNMFIPGSTREKFLEQVIDWLSDRGVKILD